MSRKEVVLASYCLVTLNTVFPNLYKRDKWLLPLTTYLKLWSTRLGLGPRAVGRGVLGNILAALQRSQEYLGIHLQSGSGGYKAAGPLGPSETY